MLNRNDDLTDRMGLDKKEYNDSIIRDYANSNVTSRRASIEMPEDTRKKLLLRRSLNSSPNKELFDSINNLSIEKNSEFSKDEIINQSLTLGGLRDSINSQSKLESETGSRILMLDPKRHSVSSDDKSSPLPIQKKRSLGPMGGNKRSIFSSMINPASLDLD